MLEVFINKESRHEWEIPSHIQIEYGVYGWTLRDRACSKENSYIRAINESVWGLKQYEIIFRGIEYSVAKSVYRLYNEQSEIFEEIAFYGKPTDSSN